MSHAWRAKTAGRGAQGLTLTLLLAASLAVSGCAHFKNPFQGDGAKGKYKGTGKRIPIATFDQSLKISDALKGQDFYLPPPQPVPVWPDPSGPLDQTVENAAAGKDFTIAWRENIGAKSDRKTYVTASPVTGDGRVYTMDGAARVSAYDEATGHLIWRRDMAERSKHDKEGFGGGLAFDGGHVFVSSGYRFVASVDAATGKVAWRTDTESPVHAAPPSPAAG